MGSWGIQCLLRGPRRSQDASRAQNIDFHMFFVGWSYKRGFSFGSCKVWPQLEPPETDLLRTFQVESQVRNSQADQADPVDRPDRPEMGHEAQFRTSHPTHRVSGRREFREAPSIHKN